LPVVLISRRIPGGHRRRRAWRLLPPLLLLLTACPAPKPAPRGNPPAATRATTLTILFTNDLHGQLEPLVLHTPGQPPRKFRVGGALALAATVAELRARASGPTILLDAGDFMQGTLLSNQFQGQPMRDLMTAMRYDAAAVGNHEFDFGPAAGADAKDLRGALKAWAAEVPFPLLAANITTAGGATPGWPNLRRSVLLERGGVRVGIVGLSTPTTPKVTMAGIVEGLRFGPMLPAAVREAKALRKQGAHVVVLLAHADGGCQGREPGSCRGEMFSQVLDQLPPGLVDAVVLGHGHKGIWHRYKGVVVSEACSRGVAVGRIQIRVAMPTGEVLPAGTEALPPFPVCRDVFEDTDGCDASAAGPAAAVKPNPLLTRRQADIAVLKKIVAGFQAEIAETAGRVLGQVARPLLHSLAGASGPGMLAARAMLLAVPGADFAILNPRAVRADLPAGPVTYGQLYSALPFENRLATVKVTPSQLRELLDAGKDHRGDIFQVAGLRLTVRCGRPPTVLAVQHQDGKALETDRLYTVVLSDFLLAGGDGLGKVLKKVPAERKAVLPEGTVRGAVEAFLAAEKRPINSEADPVISRAAPQLVLEDGPCHAGKAPVRYLCR